MDYLFESEARVSAAWRSTLMSFEAFIFLLDMVADVAVASQLLKREPWAGAVSLSLVFLPILAYGVHEVIKMCNSEEELSWQKVVGRVLDVLFCPMFALLRYTEKLFWLVEASMAKTQEQRETAERRSEEPRRIEWYMAWRAMFQAAPQSLLQMMQLILIGDVKLRSMQVICSLTSILSVTLFAAKFSRFESQDSSRAPWRHKKLISDRFSRSQSRFLIRSESQNSKTEQNVSSRTGDVTDSAGGQTQMALNSSAGNKDSGIEADEPGTPPPMPPPALPPRAADLPAPRRPPSRVINSVETDSIMTEKDYKKLSFMRYSYVERSERVAERVEMANRRSSYHYLQAIESDGSNRNSNDVRPIITPPDFPAPAPPDKFSTVARSAVKLPSRKKGRKYLEQDSAVGKGILHLHWFLFIISRVMAVGGLLSVVPLQLVTGLVAAACALGHVAAMAAVISVNSDRSTTQWWRSTLLAFCSLYCLVEYGVKFEKISRIMLIYWPLCFVENFAAGFLVYRPDQTSVVENWWFIYLFYTTIVTYVLAVACLVFYKAVLAPKRYVIYYE